MKRLVAVAASLTVAAAGLAITATSTATAAPAAAPAKAARTSYQPPALQWHACADPTLQSYGSQCADLVVPLDYSKPKGTKITLAVSRLKHTSPDSKYQGPMLVNPGGPGGSGLIYSVFGQGDFIPGDGDISYDWIGFDPRGVGDSRPALTCDPSFFGYDRPPFEPTTKAIGQAWLTRSKNYAADCKTSAAGRAGLLKHVRTTDTVKDMESLRKALGSKKISLYGFSYGTYLGQVYATKHPKRVNRFVLDGVVDPSRVWYKSNLDQDVAFEKTINVFFAYVAKHDDLWHLGTTAKQVRRAYFDEVDALNRHAAGGVIGGDELNDVMLSAGYYVYGWVDLAGELSALVNDGDYSGIKAEYDATNPQTPGSDNGNAIYLATICTDARWPSNLSKIYRDNVRTNRVAPFETWDNAWFNGPCSYWPVEGPKKPVAVTGTKVKSNILLISETLDAATPYSGALEVRKRFPRSALIEGVGGTTHAGSLSGVACTDDTIGRYLTDGTIPARKKGNRSDLKCPPVPAPDPTAPQALRKGVAPQVSALRERLQRQLAQAQVH